MKVLIVGAAGYLGEHIVQAALLEGHDVTVMVREGSGTRFAGVSRQLEGDLRDGAFVALALMDVEAVIFAAGRNFQFGLPPNQYATQNLAITETFFTSLTRTKASVRVVFVSSMSALTGSLEPFVFTEASGREHVHAARLNPYDLAKIACERLARDAAAAGRDVVILNPGLMLGPVASPRSPISGAFMSSFSSNRNLPMVPCGGHGYCDVRDVARANIAALTQGDGQYILGGDNLDSMGFYRLLSEQTGDGLPPRIPPALAFYLMAALDGVSAATFGRWRSPVHRDFARSLPLYYWGNSGRAERDLNYRRRPLARTIRDTLADLARRGIHPLELGHVHAMTDENQQALLLFRQLANGHLHRENLLPRIADVLAACLQNYELAAALDEALAGGRFEPARGRFHWDGQRPKAALAKLRMLLDHCYYASDEFRARVS